MRITIIASLFPPDIGSPAPYVKNLIKKLPHQQVTLILYGHLPEDVPNISYTKIDKRNSKIILFILAIKEIIKASKNSDIIFVNNGPSTELPILICSFFTNKPIVLCISDPLALKASFSGLYGLLHKLCLKRMTGIIKLPEDSKLYLPIEKLPFIEIDSNLEIAQKKWWKEHTIKILSYAKK